MFWWIIKEIFVLDIFQRINLPKIFLNLFNLNEFLNYNLNFENEFKQ